MRPCMLDYSGFPVGNQGQAPLCRTPHRLVWARSTARRHLRQRRLSSPMERLDQNTRPNTQTCGVEDGTLPGCCAPMAFPYVPMQENNPVRFSRMEALQTGTLFPGLDLPFKAAIQAKNKLPNTAMAELMALDFAINELGLYLVTHANDREVLQLYWSYINLAKEGREKYQKLYGPLLQTDLTPEDGYAWLKDPWPWEVGGND